MANCTCAYTAILNKETCHSLLVLNFYLAGANLAVCILTCFTRKRYSGKKTKKSHCLDSEAISEKLSQNSASLKESLKCFRNKI